MVPYWSKPCRPGPAATAGRPGTGCEVCAALRQMRRQMRVPWSRDTKTEESELTNGVIRTTWSHARACCMQTAASSVYMACRITATSDKISQKFPTGASHTWLTLSPTTRAYKVPTYNMVLNNQAVYLESREIDDCTGRQFPRSCCSDGELWTALAVSSGLWGRGGGAVRQAVLFAHCDVES